jgi:L-threonylcarbamoyladenylate synthase
MRVLKATKSSVPDALNVISQGGVIIIPTETVYGLAGDAESEVAIAKLKELKGSENSKMLQRLAANIDDVRQRVSNWEPPIKRMAAKFWPGPLTMIVESVGWRVPDHPFLRDLIRRFGRPLAATSANLSGQNPALSCEEAAQVFEGKIDLALDGGRGSVGRASSVVRVTGSDLEILREEAISRDELLKCWTSGAGTDG